MPSVTDVRRVAWLFKVCLGFVCWIAVQMLFKIVGRANFLTVEKIYKGELIAN